MVEVQCMGIACSMGLATTLYEITVYMLKKIALKETVVTMY